MIARLGKWCFEHKGRTLAAWLVVLVGLGIVSGSVGGTFDGNPESPDSESSRGFEVLEESFGGQGAGFRGSLVFESEDGVDDPSVKAAMEKLFVQVDDIEGITVVSPYDDPTGRQTSSIGDNTNKIAYADLELSADLDQVEAAELGVEIAELVPDAESSVDGLRIEVGGSALSEFEPPSSELIGLAFAILVLIFAFGSVLAMGLPIGVALFGVGVGASLIMLLSNLTSVPDFALTLGAMIGIGVGIDYALFIVTRYREALHLGKDGVDACFEAMDTAGRAVIFAGMTVVISLLGMLLMGLPFVSGLGIASALTVAVTMLASVTLLPSLLSFAGHRIELTRYRGLIGAGLLALALLALGFKLMPLAAVAAGLAVLVLTLGAMLPFFKEALPARKPKPVRETFWYKWSRQIQHHPVVALVGGLVVLAVMAAPVTALRMGFSDDGNFAEDTTVRQAYDLLSEGFGPGFNGPLTIATRVSDEADLAALQELVDVLVEDPGIASVTPAVPNNSPFVNAAATPDTPLEAALISVIPATSPQDVRTEELVERLRTETVPEVLGDSGLDAYVTGFVALSIDFTQYMSDRMPLFIGVVLALSFLLLMTVFRSVMVPLKAVLMNLISIGAAYGVVVAVFQWAWLSDIFGVAGPGPIEPFIPMMMFAIVFGLSMDYEVFLLSRIKEEYDRTGDSRNSVADGLAMTARVISAAAAIMVVVFGSFLFEDNRVIKLMGMGLATAVLLDATLVRMLLVPATMELLGDKNWWLPKWLDKILPNIEIEGHYDREVPGESDGSMVADATSMATGADADDAARV